MHRSDFSAVPSCLCTVLHFLPPAAAVFPRLSGRCLLLFCPRPWLIRRTTPCLTTSSFLKRRKRLWLQRRQPLRLRNVGHFAVSLRRLGHFGCSGRSGLRVRLLYGLGSPRGSLSAPPLRFRHPVVGICQFGSGDSNAVCAGPPGSLRWSTLGWVVPVGSGHPPAPFDHFARDGASPGWASPCGVGVAAKPRLTFRHNRALAGTRPRTQPQNVGPSRTPKTFAPLRAAFPAVTVCVAVL